MSNTIQFPFLIQNSDNPEPNVNRKAEKLAENAFHIQK